VFANLRSYHDYQDILCATAEGICFAHLYHIRNLIASGSRANVIRLTGGASRNPYWCQMFADVTGFKTEVPDSEQTGTLGLCMMVCLGIGRFKTLEEAVDSMVKVKNTYHPDPKKTKIYQEKYSGFVKLLNGIRS
jgi:L-xylulokinase